MLKDSINHVQDATGTTVGTVIATILTAFFTNIGLINQVLGAVSVFFGIIACCFLIRANINKGNFWKKKTEMLEKSFNFDDEDENG